MKDAFSRFDTPFAVTLGKKVVATLPPVEPAKADTAVRWVWPDCSMDNPLGQPMESDMAHPSAPKPKRPTVKPTRLDAPEFIRRFGPIVGGSGTEAQRGAEPGNVARPAGDTEALANDYFNRISVRAAESAMVDVVRYGSAFARVGVALGAPGGDHSAVASYIGNAASGAPVFKSWAEIQGESQFKRPAVAQTFKVGDMVEPAEDSGDRGWSDGRVVRISPHGTLVIEANSIGRGSQEILRTPGQVQGWVPF